MPRHEHERRGGLVAYYRVSTQRQGESGLGLEAQQEAVARHAERTGLYVGATFTEVESGRNNERPELAKALAHAKRTGATLVVAKLDRLTRDTRFLLGVADSGANVAFLDLPDLPPGPQGRFVLTMFAAVAELERGMIAQRTKAGMAAFKAGRRVPKRFRDLYGENVPAEIVEATAGKLGASLPQCRPLTDEARRAGGAKRGRAITAKAAEEWDELRPRILGMRSTGMTLRAIAGALNAEGYTSNAGTPLQPVHVHRVLKRANHQ